MDKALGLAVGVACALFAILYIRDENSFDRFYTKADRLFRITTITADPLNGEAKVIGASGQVQGPSLNLSSSITSTPTRNSSMFLRFRSYPGNLPARSQLPIPS